MLDFEKKCKFEFGKVDYNNNGRKTNLVSLEMTLKVINNKPIFSASGEVWNTSHTDIVMGGQCIDDIYNEFKGQLVNRKQYEAIMTLWEKWHLNDMNAGCIHQRAENWGEKVVKIARLKLDYDKALKQRSDIKNRIEEEVKKNGTVKISEADRILLNLPYSLTIPEEKTKDYPLYKVESIEEKATRWLNEEEHPLGVMSKSCKVCGYKYGTAWVYQPIDKKDLSEMCRIMNIDLTKMAQIVRLGA